MLCLGVSYYSVSNMHITNEKMRFTSEHAENGFVDFETDVKDAQRSGRRDTPDVDKSMAKSVKTSTLRVK